MYKITNVVAILAVLLAGCQNASCKEGSKKTLALEVAKVFNEGNLSTIYVEGVIDTEGPSANDIQGKADQQSCAISEMKKPLEISLTIDRRRENRINEAAVSALADYLHLTTYYKEEEGELICIMLTVRLSSSNGKVISGGFVYPSGELRNFPRAMVDLFNGESGIDSGESASILYKFFKAGWFGTEFPEP